MTWLVSLKSRWAKKEGELHQYADDTQMDLSFPSDSQGMVDALKQCLKMVMELRNRSSSLITLQLFNPSYLGNDTSPMVVTALWADF